MTATLLIIAAALFIYGFFQSRSGSKKQIKVGYGHKDIEGGNVPFTSTAGFIWGVIVVIATILFSLTD